MSYYLILMILSVCYVEIASLVLAPTIKVFLARSSSGKIRVTEHCSVHKFESFH